MRYLLVFIGAALVGGAWTQAQVRKMEVSESSPLIECRAGFIGPPAPDCL